MSRGPELIITEKDNAARRIADILSGETASAERMNGVNVYKWGGKRCIGLSGHVVGVDFPPEYNDWRDVEPVELIGAPVEKHPTQENIVAALRRLARRAGKVTIATDYDREGELIGKEAYELVRDVNEDVPVDRVRFSSITNREVTEAFENPDDLDFDLAAAGEARQIIDLVWGAALTRFLSLSARQLGNDFISVGRVQGPTLKLIVDREREIDAFDPEDYWELFSKLTKDADGDAESFEAQYFYLDDDGTEAERIWDEDDAEEAYQTLLGVEAAEVSSVNRRTRTDTPPAPFNTTQFIRAAGSIGYSAQRAMSIAEDLYTAGYITYPRTDNTVYPDDLDPRELLGAFEGDRRFKEDAESLLEQEEIEPTEGDNETTDHPPIHPTGELPSASDLSDDEWDVYELVVRRFFATVAEDAVWEHLRVVAEVEGLSLKANGKRLLEAGYHDVYPYFNSSESFVPDVEEGESLVLSDTHLDAKQTQPPRRYGQSRLIETMEQMGIGTKATRHDVIQKLYDRGYIESDPPRPTRLARAVVEASEDFAKLIVSEEMTSQLESDMLAIARGEATLEDVTEESKEMLGEVFEGLMESREELGKQLQDSLKADKTVGTCPDCGGDLVVRKSRRGSYFIGCDSYPDCTYTLPLPSTGKPLIMEESCEDHDLHHIKMLAGRKTFVHGCPLCKAEEADEEDDLVIGTCPECGEEHDGELAIKRLRSGSRLVGCTRYPDCDYSLPLPRRGDIEVTDESCEEHDLPELRITYEGDREPWELGCPICNYREYQAQQNGEGGSELESINGIGAKTAEKLKDAGIEDVKTLKASEPDDIAAKVEGVGADTVRKWQTAAD
ncbi:MULTISPECIES: DNA topoisomerase I [Haloferax]|uniref:DNA topoisomerase 1 n=5 Tax=Haloferax TaxID=2251 RepID=D4GT20_HALVD|nr:MULTISPECIES: DNA topoisomerase I [Haloferax]ADE03158.1 DNA topoisomerase 1 [Haloferax volcanii DS2]ELY26453.1 DNA topoisomerase I [Haloferax volcanii DS2]ELZ92447.1 DNA topoisomerase I [Haloferax alexandrinus JCM 10717]MBC9985478.1 DNA topoisomerase I [Haloferax sp. AS1]MBS8119767.1 DNA topoisomerase I [Haloferax volcanii]